MVLPSGFYKIKLKTFGKQECSLFNVTGERDSRFVRVEDSKQQNQRHSFLCSCK